MSITSLLGGCIHSEHYERTYKTYYCNGLYSNIYDVSWWGIYKERGVRAIYITDSLNFSINLGVYGEYDSYGCKIEHDTLYIEKKTIDNSETPTVVERRKYSLKTLKESKTFNR